MSFKIEKDRLIEERLLQISNETLETILRKQYAIPEKATMCFSQNSTDPYDGHYEITGVYFMWEDDMGSVKELLGKETP